MRCDRARRGAEPVGRVLGVDAAFEGRAADADVCPVANGSGSPAAMRICALIRSMPGDHLRHRVLDLDAGVDLDEVEMAVAVDDELDGAGVGVVGGLDQADGGRRTSPGGRRRRAAGRGFLDQLLVPPLDGAVAFPEVDDVAVGVGEDLDLDVPGMLDVFLQVDARRCRTPPRPRPAACLSAVASGPIR